MTLKVGKLYTIPYDLQVFSELEGFLGDHTEMDSKLLTLFVVLEEWPPGTHNQDNHCGQYYAVKVLTPCGVLGWVFLSSTEIQRCK